jgi:hydroxyquinol 1,2-dioxygenase
MRSVTKDNITDVFMNYFGPDTDPRLREILQSLVTHLHNFARETNLTHAEWRKGIEFLEWAGDISDKERHEFVLLSDVLGLSSLVDMLHSHPEGTSSSVLGPFHITGSPPLPIGGDLRGDFKEQVLLAQGMSCGTWTAIPLRVPNSISGRRHRMACTPVRTRIRTLTPSTGSKPRAQMADMHSRL